MVDFFSSMRLQLIDGRRVGKGSPGVLRELLPEAPGVYVWTRRLEDASNQPATGSDRLRAIEAAQGTHRKKQPETGRVGRYRQVHIYDDPRPLTSASFRRLDVLTSASRDDLTWVLFAASLFQRPLYVGKALNFRDRIPEHFNYNTAFTKALNADGLGVDDCMVALLPVCDPPDGSTVSPPGRNNDDIDRHIRLAESLIIRGLHPVYNEKMD